MIMNKDELFNYAIGKLSNKKVSNAQKAVVRQLINADVVRVASKDRLATQITCIPEVKEFIDQNGEKYYYVPQTGGSSKSPSKDRLAFILAAIAVAGLWVIGLGLWALAHHLT